MILKNKKQIVAEKIEALTVELAALAVMALSILSVPAKVFADPTTVNTAINLKNPLGDSTEMKTFIDNVLGGVILILTPVVVIMVVYSGFLFVSAQGNTEKLKEAKKALTYTLIGAAIIIGAKGIQAVIGTTVTNLVQP